MCRMDCQMLPYTPHFIPLILHNGNTGGESELTIPRVRVGTGAGWRKYGPSGLRKYSVNKIEELIPSNSSLSSCVFFPIEKVGQNQPRQVGQNQWVKFNLDWWVKINGSNSTGSKWVGGKSRKHGNILGNILILRLWENYKAYDIILWTQ